MEVRFLIDHDTGLPHIDRHDVSPLEVLEVLRHHEGRLRQSDGTWIVEGQTQAGRYLRVIYRISSKDDSLLIITAYDLTGKPLQAFRRRKRRRG